MISRFMEICPALPGTIEMLTRPLVRSTSSGEVNVYSRTELSDSVAGRRREVS